MIKIVVVTLHDCVRVFKENDLLLSGLGREDYEIHLLTGEAGTGWNFFKTANFYYYGGRRGGGWNWQKVGFRESVRKLGEWVKPDIWHIHNEPDWIADEVIKARDGGLAGGKVVWDIHDPASGRFEMVPIEEIEIAAGVDGLVYVSGEEREWMERVHPRLKGLPNAVIHSCYPLSRLAECKWYNRRLKGSIVYEGGISPPYSNKDKEKVCPFTNRGTGEMDAGGHRIRSYEMRDYGETAHMLNCEGFKLFIYGSDANIGSINPIAEQYREYGAIAMPSCDPVHLVGEMSQYEFGLVGFPMRIKLFDMALPNKFFDYLCGGVIPIVINAPAVAELVDKHDLGWSFGGTDGRIEKGALHKILLEGEDVLNRKRANIKEFIKGYYMEAQIGRLKELYAKLIRTETGSCVGNGDARN